MMAAIMFALLVATVWLIIRIREIARVQQLVTERLDSISSGPGRIRLKDKQVGAVDITAGGILLEGPLGFNGPRLWIGTVAGTVESVPYHYYDGTVGEVEHVRDGGFDIGFGTLTLPEEPLPPTIQVEFRGDTVKVRTWHAKLENVEWKIGDGY